MVGFYVGYSGGKIFICELGSIIKERSFQASCQKTTQFNPQRHQIMEPNPKRKLLL